MAKDSTLRLMAILAHPDDETLGNGAALARYAAEGVDVTLVTATRGQYGWLGDPDANPGPSALGRQREAEPARLSGCSGCASWCRWITSTVSSARQTASRWSANWWPTCVASDPRWC